MPQVRTPYPCILVARLARVLLLLTEPAPWTGPVLAYWLLGRNQRALAHDVSLVYC